MSETKVIVRRPTPALGRYTSEVIVDTAGADREVALAKAMSQARLDDVIETIEVVGGREIRTLYDVGSQGPKFKRQVVS